MSHESRNASTKDRGEISPKDIGNREDCHVVLECLYRAYPEKVPGGKLMDNTGMENIHLASLLQYLAEHGLITPVEVKADEWDKYEKITQYVWSATVITAQGIDLLRDDGGMGRLLSATTLILDEEQIRKLLLEGIAKAKGDETLKGRLKAVIKNMPATQLSTALTELGKYGLNHFQDALQVLSGI